MKIHLSDRILETQKSAFVMGIINATPDSFFEKSRISQSLNETIENSLKMIEDGADILDIGGESTRPGSEYIGENEEIDRVLPILEGIRKFDKNIAISIDTRKTNVIKTCVKSGADILNDISALEDGENIAEFVSESKIPVILMHKRGIPFTMQKNTKYADVINEVSEYLCERADFAFSKGISPEKIIFDLMPEKFTLTELQNVFEIILQKELIKSNFRRKIAEFVTQTEDSEEGRRYRKAKHFKRNVKKFYE